MSDIQAQLSVLKQTADAKVVDAIARLIKDGEDHELNRVNVLDFATQHGVDEEHASTRGTRQAGRHRGLLSKVACQIERLDPIVGAANLDLNDDDIVLIEGRA